MKNEGLSFVDVSLCRLLVSVILSVLFASCGSHGTQTTSGTTPGTGSVSFSAVWESPPEGAFKPLNLPSDGVQGSAIQQRALAGDVCTDYLVDWVYLEVWSGSNKVAGDRFECSRHTGNLLNVPAGDNLSFQVYATVTGYTNPFWRMQDNITFSLSPGEEKQFNGIVMGYVGPTTAPPQVSSYSPDNNAMRLPATTVVRFSLDKPMVERTVTDNDAVVMVDANSTKIPGRTIYDNASWSAVFSPSTRLTAGMGYTVTLSTSMTDRAAQGLVSPVSWNFTVYQPGGWRSPLLLETNDNTALGPKIASNGSGNAVAVWEQYDGTRYHIWSRLYTPSGGGWGTATLVETDNVGSAGNTQVGMDGNGNAVAVWEQSDGSIWANRYTPSGGWGTATHIETYNGYVASSPQVAMDGSGNAVAVWQQSDGTRTNIWANRYTPSGGWGTATLIETDNAGGAVNPQIAMDGGGNAVAVWQQSDGTRTNIWANRFTPSGGWGTATLIETDNAGDALYPQVAMDGSGNAVAVWQQSDGTRTNIWANRFTPSGGWGTATLIETYNGYVASSPQVAMDGSGNAVAVWQQSDGTRTNIWANRYTPSGGWGTATTLIESSNAGEALLPQVAMDGSGNAIAVWEQYDGTRRNIWANRYTPSGGWKTATLIETDNAGGSRYPQVAMDNNGNAFAVWQLYDGSRFNIWATRYTSSAEWDTATLIETDNAGDAIYPHLAMDGSGNAVAVWTQSDGIRYNIWANRFTPSGGWGTAALIEFNNAGSAGTPQVAMDGGGNAVAVWQQSDGTRDNIWANRFTPSGGWGTATIIKSDISGSAGPQVAMDSSGNAVAVWQQYDGIRYNMWANRFTPSGGWGTATLIETDNAGDAMWPRVAMDGSGNAVAVWEQSDGIRFNVWANRYTPSGGWGTAMLIETDNAGNAQYPSVTMDGSGNAVAVWEQSDGIRFNVWANRYTPSGGWGTAALIETDNAGDALYPQVAMDGSGNAVAVWEQSDGIRFNIWANRFTPSGGWGTATLIETGNAGAAVNSQVAMDGSGNAVAVWMQYDGIRYNMWANQYTPSGGWGTATLIETDNAGNVQSTQVVMDGSGNAVAVWQQSDGIRFNIWANRYY